MADHNKKKYNVAPPLEKLSVRKSVDSSKKCVCDFCVWNFSIVVGLAPALSNLRVSGNFALTSVWSHHNTMKNKTDRTVRHVEFTQTTNVAIKRIGVIISQRVCSNQCGGSC